jgi:hypothetical protein
MATVAAISSPLSGSSGCRMDAVAAGALARANPVVIAVSPHGVPSRDEIPHAVRVYDFLTDDIVARRGERVQCLPMATRSQWPAKDANGRERADPITSHDPQHPC